MKSKLTKKEEAIMNKPIKKEIDGFIKVCFEMIKLKNKKAGDYKNSWKILGIQGLNYQLMRKMTRIWINKDKKKEELNCEMLRDSYIDLAVYAIMCVQLMDEGELEDSFEKLLKN